MPALIIELVDSNVGIVWTYLKSQNRPV